MFFYEGSASAQILGLTRSAPSFFIFRRSMDPVRFIPFEVIEGQFMTMYFTYSVKFIPNSSADDASCASSVEREILKSTLEAATSSLQEQLGAEEVKSELFGHGPADGPNMYYLCISWKNKFCRDDITRSRECMESRIHEMYEQKRGCFVFEFALEEYGHIKVTKNGSNWRQALAVHCRQQQNQARPPGTLDCSTKIGLLT
jgi:hypothetical protein